MPTELERIQSEPHLVLRECAVLFNDHDRFAQACHYHREERLLPLLSATVNDVIPHASDVSTWSWDDVRDHDALFKIIKAYSKYLTPIHIWLAAGFSKGELHLFRESFAKAQTILTEKLRATNMDSVLDYVHRQRTHIDTAKIRARKKPSKKPRTSHTDDSIFN
jgi:hypothetical protein